MSQDPFEILQKAKLLFSRGNYKEAFELLDSAENVAIENNRQDALASIYFTAGNNLEELGHFENAKKYLDRTLEITEKLAAENSFYSNWVTMTLDNLGHLLWNMGRLNEAKLALERSLKLNESLLETNRKNTVYQSGVAMTLNNLGAVLIEMGNLDEAKPALERALKIRESLLEADQNSTIYQSDVAMTLNNHGNLFFKMVKLDEAKLAYERALKIRESLLEVDRNNPINQLEAAKALNNLGALIIKMGRLDEAKPAYERALKIYESLLETDRKNTVYQSQVAGALNNLGNLLRDMGRMDEAKTAFEHSLKIYESLLEIDRKNTVYQSHVSMTLDNLGALLRHMGRMDGAKMTFERALEMRELLLETDPESTVYQSDVAMTLNNLGALLGDMGRMDEAKTAYERALKIYESLLETDRNSIVYQSQVATTLNNLGHLFRNMGRMDEAKTASERALKIYESLLETDRNSIVYQSQVATTLNNLGALLGDMGRMDEAKPAFERALKIYESLLEIDRKNTVYQSHVSMTLDNLGALLRHMGRLDGAKTTSERALEMRELLLETDPESTVYQSDVAMTLNNLGALLGDMGRPDEAKLKFLRSLKIYGSLLETDRNSTIYQSHVSMTLHNLGALLIYMGWLDEAKTVSERALEMRELLLETDPESTVYQSDVAMTLNNLGHLLQGEMNFSQALDYHSRALSQVSQSGNPDLFFRIFWGRGRCHERIGKLEEAYEDYRDSIDQIEHIRSQFSLEEYKLDIMGDKENAYSDMISFLCTKKKDVRMAWEYVGRAKSRTLLEGLRLIELPAPQSIPEDIIKNEKTLLDSIRILDRQARKSEKADQVNKISQEIKNAQDELDKLYIQIEKYAPDYVDLRKGLPLRFEGIKDLLNNQSKRTALIEYYTTREKVFIFVIQSKESQPEVRIIDLSCLFSWDDIPGNDNVRLIEFLKKKFGIDWLETATIEKIDNDRTIGLSFENNSLSLRLNDEKTKVNLKIDDVRTDEFIARTENGKLNIYAPSSNQLLEYVNTYFSEVVGYPQEPWRKQTWQELAEHLIAPVFEDIKGCEMLYIIPHGLLHYLPLHALYINGKYLIEHFPVIFAPAAATIKYAQEKGSGKLEACLSMGFTDDEKEKELFEGEAILVYNKFKEGTLSSMEPILDKNATSERLIKEAAGKDIIHLSCHGYFNQQEPLNSGLLLSDGWLIVKDIFGMSMDADLLALSACETGINEQKPGDELVGLTRAFLYTGTRSVMVTLWKVSPESTFILMDSFYEKLKDEKISKAKALQEIQVELMRLTAQEAIDYYEKIKTQLKGYEAFSTHRLIDRIIADTRLNAHDFKEALKEYKELLPGMDPQSDEYKQLKKNISKCQLALSSPEPADYDYGKHVYAHPYYWAPFVLVGDWR